MANTVIQLRHSNVTGNTPVSLANGEIAINTYDGILFYRGGPSNTIQQFSSTAQPSGLDGEVQFNDNGNLGASDKLTFDKVTGLLETTNLTASNVTTRTYIQFGDGTRQYTANSGAGGGGGSSAAIDRQTYTATTAQTDFSINYTSPYVLVTINGVIIDPTEYIATNNTSITLITGTQSGDVVDLIGFAGNVVTTAIDQTARDFGFSAGIYANGAFKTANSAYDHANAAFNAANTAGGSGADQFARNQANAAFITANSADDKATSGGIYANGAFESANSSGIYANGAFISANSAGSYANASFITANSAGVYANGAFDAANSKLNLSGGTITGSLNVTSNIVIGAYIDMNTQPSNPPRVEGRLFYDKGQHALSYYNEQDMTLQIGQEHVLRVWNNSGTTILNGKAVIIVPGASANSFPNVALANAATQSTSEVVGIATQDIPPTGYGYVTSVGKVNDLDTSLFIEGKELFLSDTVPGGYTNTPPSPPSVPINIGYTTFSDPTAGAIYVSIHLMEGVNKTNGAILFARNSAIDEDPLEFHWDYVNKRLGINTENPQANLHVAGDGLFTGNVTISGNLNISNAQSIVTQTLDVGGNLIILNSNTVGTPIANAEIRVNRGNETNAFIRWDESINEWVSYEGSGTIGHIITSEKTATTWEEYTAFQTYEKISYPIGANLANATNETAKTADARSIIAENQAIAGFHQANAAYATANSASVYANASFIAANSAGIYANGAFAAANAATATDATQNTNITSASNYANGAFGAANSASVYANAAFATANTTKVRTINFVIDGGGSVITTGSKGNVFVDFSGTIDGWTILGDASGTVTVDVSKSTYATFPTFTASGGTSPALSTSQKNQRIGIDWSGFTTISANDILRFAVSGTPATVTLVTVALRITST